MLYYLYNSYTSSWAIVMLSVTLEKMVGSTKYPLLPNFFPPHSNFAPCVLPNSIYFNIFCSLSESICGPFRNKREQKMIITTKSDDRFVILSFTLHNVSGKWIANLSFASEFNRFSNKCYKTATGNILSRFVECEIKNNLQKITIIDFFLYKCTTAATATLSILKLK